MKMWARGAMAARHLGMVEAPGSNPGGSTRPFASQKPWERKVFEQPFAFGKKPGEKLAKERLAK